MYKNIIKSQYSMLDSKQLTNRRPNQQTNNEQTNNHSVWGRLCAAKPPLDNLRLDYLILAPCDFRYACYYFVWFGLKQGM